MKPSSKAPRSKISILMLTVLLAIGLGGAFMLVYLSPWVGNIEAPPTRVMPTMDMSNYVTRSVPTMDMSGYMKIADAQATLAALNHVTLPSFPWPPPQASARASLSLGSLESTNGVQLTLGDVDSRILKALSRAGYEEISYFSIPDGYAVVTQLEHISPDGYPEYSDRWASKLSPITFGDFSLKGYLQALFSVPQGHYRIFVFLVTPDQVVESGTPVSKLDAQAWAMQGGNRLPSELASAPYPKGQGCAVYVYEFIQSGVGEQANLNVPSDITGKQHLERAGLWDALEK